MVAVGAVYGKFFAVERCPPTGVIREITVTAKKDGWRFTPEEIQADCGDKLAFTVVNEDEYDHGIAIDAFAISRRMPKESTIEFEISLTKAGEFPYYCSVPCGEGVVDGVKRTHFDMIGRIKVKND